MLSFSTYATFEESQVSALQQLLAECQLQDSVIPKIYWEKLSQQRDYISHFVCHQDARWLGYLGHFIFYPQGSDVTGCVHPTFRRQKIFSQLWQLAQKNQLAQNCNWQWHFVCADELPSGIAFTKSVNATLTNSEAIYCRTVNTLDATSTISNCQNHLVVRQANMLDIEAISHLQVQCFPTDYHNAKAQLAVQLQDPQRKILLLYHQRKLIGKAHLRWHISLWLHDFCIAPFARRQGFARGLLRQVFNEVTNSSFEQLWLEVELDNKPAIALYQAMQFQLYRHDRYYSVSPNFE